MRTEIKINLNKKGSLENGIKELEAYKKRIDTNCKRLVSRLIEKGVQNVQYIILNMTYLDTGELLSGLDRGASIAVSNTGNGSYVGYVRINSQYAVYVEFGTGVIGTSNPHDKASEFGYSYGSYINGWWYPTDESDPNPTKKEGKDGGLIAHTQGQAAKSFMYDTAIYLGKILFETAQEVFST